MSEPNEQRWLLGEPEEGACGAIQRYFFFKKYFSVNIRGFFFLRTKKKVFLGIDLLQSQFYVLIDTPIASGIPRLSPPKLEVVKSYSKISNSNSN